MPLSPPNFNKFNFISFVLSLCFLLIVTMSHLLPSLFAGCLIFILSDALSKNLIKGHVGVRGRAVAAILVGGVFAAILTLAIFYLAKSLKTGEDNLENLMTHGAKLIEDMQKILPVSIVDILPSSVESIRDMAVEYLKEHAAEVAHIGKAWVHSFLVAVVGMIIGMLAAARNVLHESDSKAGPLGSSLAEDTSRFIGVFADVVFAQVKISLINTSLTALYIMLILPIAGVNLPYLKLLILITFIAGLLPVVGNLISNTAIVLVSLGVSLKIGISSLIFLVVIHKLEYFINAKVMGQKVSASVVELLIAMLIAEALFGIAGVVVAPLFYAFIKKTLTDRGLL